MLSVEPVPHCTYLHTDWVKDAAMDWDGTKEARGSDEGVPFVNQSIKIKYHD